jgi:hypothetical protein
MAQFLLLLVWCLAFGFAIICARFFMNIIDGRGQIQNVECLPSPTPWFCLCALSSLIHLGLSGHVIHRRAIFAEW